MEKKYINENRYKKSTNRKRRNSSTVKANLSKSNNSNAASKKIVQPIKKKQLKKKKYKKSNIERMSKGYNLLTCIILILLIALLSRLILKDENAPFLPGIFGENENEEIITVGIITNENLQDINTSNVILSEINSYSKDMLLSINEDYSISYKIISKIDKISNMEYVITKNSKSKVTTSEIKKSLEEYIQNKDSKYFSKLANIDQIKALDEDRLNITLKKADPYFIYNLDINLETVKDETLYLRDVSSNSNQLVLNRHKKADKNLPSKIIVKKYEDMYKAVEAYKQQEIKIFITNANNIENILGKSEYNINSYRNGETLFLLGNLKSKIYSRPEIRQAIAYSINRDNIIDEVLKSKGMKIDLPYIYDDVKYKYDVYAAENILLSNGYSRKNNVYKKTENGENITLELDLLVNKEDNEKVQVANIIKNNLNAIGIKINVEKLAVEQLEKRIKQEKYDLVLATVNLNNNPNIDFIQNRLYINDEIKSIQKQIEEDTIDNLQINIKQLMSNMSANISVMGIYSKVSNVIYSKSIVGIKDVNYLNIFKNLFV